MTTYSVLLLKLTAIEGQWGRGRNTKRGERGLIKAKKIDLEIHYSDIFNHVLFDPLRAWVGGSIPLMENSIIMIF